MKYIQAKQPHNNRFLAKTNQGFTIVELLIVIVIIGILAAITVVAFNGVQHRAIDVGLATTASQIDRKIGIYNATEGSYTCASCDSEPKIAQAYEIESLVPSTVDTYDFVDIQSNYPWPEADKSKVSIIYSAGDAHNTPFVAVQYWSILDETWNYSVYYGDGVTENYQSEDGFDLSWTSVSAI